MGVRNILLSTFHFIAGLDQEEEEEEKEEEEKEEEEEGFIQP